MHHARAVQEGRVGRRLDGRLPRTLGASAPPALQIELSGNPCYLDLILGLNGRNKSPFGVRARRTKVFGLAARVRTLECLGMSTWMLHIPILLQIVGVSSSAAEQRAVKATVSCPFAGRDLARVAVPGTVQHTAGQVRRREYLGDL